MIWGDFQAVIQLSAGLNVAILSFVDISLPAIKERRRVFAKARQELELHRSGTDHQHPDDAEEYAAAVQEMDRKLFLLWQESSTFIREEESLIRSTGVLGVFGAVLSLGLLWYSAEHYGGVISLMGRVLIIRDCVEFCAVAFFQAIGKRSSNMMASWHLTAYHSLTERFHSDEVALSAR